MDVRGEGSGSTRANAGSQSSVRTPSRTRAVQASTKPERNVIRAPESRTAMAPPREVAISTQEFVLQNVRPAILGTGHAGPHLLVRVGVVRRTDRRRGLSVRRGGSAASVTGRGAWPVRSGERFRGAGER
ncbi:hypothetical protein ACFPM0_05550 [Pseudonocardia sulfidoxydans]|uniref:hypothetical protein n=1 Tax=Pseudonocardia sulfidoxydans TaxID=54011 RepID=UPI0036154B8F